MQKLVYDANSKDTKIVEFTEAELAQRERDRIVAEEEAKKPIPLSLEEQIAFLKERDSRMQDDISSIIEGLTGGV